MQYLKMLHALLAALLWAAATLAYAAAPTLAPSQFNNGTPVDTDPVGHRTPVLLVHGLGGSTEGWESFLRAYEQEPSWRAAFKPYTFSYSTGTAQVLADPAAPRTITAVGGSLRDAMASYYARPSAAPQFGFNGRSVIVLAHSMGGLVARSMMQEHSFADGTRAGEKVLHLITLGTPHHGSPLADGALELGMQTVPELSETWFGFISDLTWTNFDALDMSGLRCNAWLARLNRYYPSSGGQHGKCGFVEANHLPGFYERIVAYGTRDLQSPDLALGLGVFKPGSSPALAFTYAWMRSGLARPYGNDGIVPLTSAQFEGVNVWQRREAYGCDHRFIKRGYQQSVKSWKASYTDWSFCAASVGFAGAASGRSGGYAITGTVFGDGGIVDTILTASQAERVFDWAEQAHAGYLQPGGRTTGIAYGFRYRYYPGSQTFLGVKEGEVWYVGPSSNHQPHFLTTLSTFFGQAKAAGY